MTPPMNPGSAVTRRRRLSRWLVPLAAVLVGAGLAQLLVTVHESDARDRARVDALEKEVLQLEAKAEVARILSQSTRPNADAPAPHGYTIQCRAPWQALGPIGQGLWGCRTPEPLPSGFYPNCNLTSSRIAPGLTPQQYYQSTTERSAQLTAARQLGGRAIVVRGRAAYEVSFEHESTGIPLRVLASLFVEGDRVYAVTCSAPPANFDAFASRFRQIAASFELEI